MVQRLKAEHRDFRIELIKIEDVSEFSSQKAIEMLKEIRKPILRHTVEEEVRIMRILSKKQKNNLNNRSRFCKDIKGL
jgi:ribosomal protein L31E